MNNLEAPFSFDELFFSRTDERGIILSGNDVFQRISQYSWAELIKKPHNIIRHQDMPKAVFWLLWKTIKSGKPIGAYVKNKAKDGKFYWVFAIVTPVDGGFLSVRLKPSSAIFDIIKTEYKNLLEIEFSEKLSPEKSANILLVKLKEFGFSCYEDFMAIALAAETKSRNTNLNIPNDDAIIRFEEVIKSANSLLSNSKNVFTMYQRGAYIPLNLQVKSAQLGDEGKTIAVIANNYNSITNEIKKGIISFLDSAQEVFNSINNALFLVSTTLVQKEILQVFRTETEKDNSKIIEVELLEKIEKSYFEQAIASLSQVSRLLKKFQSDYSNIKMLSSGLQVTKVMGKVESSRVVGEKIGLLELMSDLDNLQKEISSNLKIIETLNKSVDYDINILVNQVSKKQAFS
ncbi:MAG: PAS domain-containing protein [Rickettsiales bacterium]|nr:PAS domain-containing protein [Rickettsiales bacterium]